MSFVILFFVLTSFSFAEYKKFNFRSGPLGGSIPDPTYDYNLLCTTKLNYHIPGVTNVRMIPIDIIIDGEKHDYFLFHGFDDRNFKRANLKGYLCSYDEDGQTHVKLRSNVFASTVPLTENEYEKIKSESKIMLRGTGTNRSLRADDECHIVGSLRPRTRLRGYHEGEVICLDENHYYFTSRAWNYLTNFLTGGKAGSDCDEDDTDYASWFRRNPREGRYDSETFEFLEPFKEENADAKQ